MFRSLTTLIKKWRASRNAGHQLDALLAHADADASYAERSEWLIELAHWLRRNGTVQDAQAERDADTRAYPAHARLRYLFHVLDRNPAWKAHAARILRGILRECDGISLLCDAGMPVHSGFFGALFERIDSSLIPPAPNRRELSALFTLMFPTPEDAKWIDALPDDLLARLAELISFDVTEEERHEPGSFSRDLLAALHNLTCQISSTGLSQTVRSRLSDDDARKPLESQPFYRLTRAMLAVETAHAAVEDGGDPSKLLHEVNYLRVLLDECRIAVDDVFAHLYRNGVSVDIVFQVERMRMRILRAETLLNAWMARDDLHGMAHLTAELVDANQNSQSVAHLVRSNFSLFARKLVETNADTGEHYISRGRAEYLKMLRMAAGGGLVTVVTVCVKFAITGAHLQSMLEGLLAGINYAASFMLMHFLHFTLATKQPAMTAPTLARELDDTGHEEGVKAFVASVIALIRTQAAAISGNVLVVLPVCLLVQLFASNVLHANLISPEKAHATLHSFSLLGPTPFYAALTGVLLWASSLLAGWADNWFVLHRVGDALAYNRRLRLTLGAAGAAKLAHFCRSNVAGVVANVGLGLMLGLIPAIVTVFMFPFAYNSGLLHVLTRLMSSPTLFEFFAPCPRGLEAALAAELAEIAGRHLNGAPFTAGAQVPGGVHFSGGWAAGMAANLHSRIASRILLKIAHGPYRNEQDVYALALEQPWERWFASTQTLRIDITAIKSPLKSLEFTTLRVKDAICDRMREKTGARPSIDTGAPDVRVFAFLTANECTLYLDTSGEPLFKRGWRLDKGAAPLRENLAAGILRLTGWTPGTALYDPMCGSGTFLAEAAQIALGVAPGVERRFGFEKLKQYDITAWQGLKVPALDAKRAARARRGEALGVYGSDISGDMLEKARANLERAGVPSVWLKQVDARGMTPPSDGPGILLANPPYGERIEVRGRSARGEVRETGRNRGNDDAFRRTHTDAPDSEFFNALGDALKQRFTGWQAFLLTSDRSLPGQLRLRESAKTPLFNGALECRLFRFDLIAGSVKARPAAAEGDA